MSLREHLREISVPVYTAVMVFAIASWVDISGVWVEVPLMINVLPEGWNLPSYLIIIIQTANVGPLAYTLAKKLAPTKVQYWWVIYLIIGIGVTACLLLVFFWDKTTYVGGTEHSTALLVLTMFLALVDCTSSVVFLPYMALYSPQYLTAFYVGDGLSGLIPAIVGLIQGVGGDPFCVNTTDPSSNGTGYFVLTTYEPPLFSVNVFYGLLLVLLLASAFAFTLLHFHPAFKRHQQFNSAATTTTSSHERLTNAAHTSPQSTDCTATYTFSDQLATQTDLATTSDVITPIDVITQTDVITPANVVTQTDVITPADLPFSTEATQQKRKETYFSSLSPADRPTSVSSEEATFSLRSRVVLTQLVLVGWISFLIHGVLPSIQSYSCIPYGNLAYNLAVRLSLLANPVACFFGLFFQVRSTVVCVILVLVGIGLSGYQIALAALSPYPPLYDETIGVVLVVGTFVLLTAIFSYAKLSLASLLSASGGVRGLLWCGSATQIGSFIGAVLIFVLINHVKLFTSKYPCT